MDDFLEMYFLKTNNRLVLEKTRRLFVEILSVYNSNNKVSVTVLLIEFTAAPSVSPWLKKP